MWILYNIGRFPHFLDIRRFMEKPRNVNTLLYREVSTFLDIRQFMEKPRNVDTLLYREVSAFFRNPEYVDSCLYMEGFTFLYIQPFDIHGIRTIIDRLYLIETTRSQMTRSSFMKQPDKVHVLPEKSPETVLQNGC